MDNKMTRRGIWCFFYFISSGAEQRRGITVYIAKIEKEEICSQVNRNYVYKGTWLRTYTDKFLSEYMYEYITFSS